MICYKAFFQAGGTRGARGRFSRAGLLAAPMRAPRTFFKNIFLIFLKNTKPTISVAPEAFIVSVISVIHYGLECRQLIDVDRISKMSQNAELSRKRHKASTRYGK